MLLPAIDMALRGALVALLVLLAGVLLRERPRAWAARCGAAMAAGLCVFVLGSVPGSMTGLVTGAEAAAGVLPAPQGWQLLSNAIGQANPVLFWVFTRSLLDDAFRPRPLHGLAWLGVAGLSGLMCSGWPGPGSPAGQALLLLLRATPWLFLGLTLAGALTQWSDDLVERRRGLRAFIVWAGSGFTLAQLLGHWLGADPGSAPPAWGNTLEMAGLALIVAVLAWRLLRLGPAELFVSSAEPDAPAPDDAMRLAVAPGASHRSSPNPSSETQAGVDAAAAGSPTNPQAAASAGTVAATRDSESASPPDNPPDSSPDNPPASDPADDRLAAALERAMQLDQAFREEGLSVASLAARLGVPQYRLRRLINQRLGHRNFSAFINRHRLAHARAALADPAQAEQPVLSLALDAGFQSIGPFNRAFKADTGLTPSEFRRQALGPGLGLASLPTGAAKSAAALAET